MAKRRPRGLQEVAKSANRLILDRTIRHAVFLERLKKTEVNTFLKFLNTEVLPDLMKKLRKRLKTIKVKGYDPGPATTKRLKEMIASVNKTIETGIRSASGTFRKDLRKIMVSEAEFQTAMMAKSTPVDLGLSTPSSATMTKIINTNPMQGLVLKGWAKQLETSTKKVIIQQLNIGLVEGETIPQITNRMIGEAGAFNKVRRNATAFVRTAVTHATTQAKEAVYAANSDIVKKVQYVAVLDNRTTVICAGLDGEVFGVYEGSRPPQHIQCRSTTIPVMKSWKELGINLKEAPPGTRASMTGQVPARLTFGQWLKGLKGPEGIKIQNQVLGKKGAELFRKGKVSIKDFTDANQNPLTLDQIRTREGL